MGITNYIFSPSSKEYVHLGHKGVRDDCEYEGPIVWIGEIRTWLPCHLLKLLLDRFREAHGSNDIMICTSDDLFESGKHLSDDDPGTEIGGDRDFDVPLTKYLPELRESHVIEEILTRTELRL
jgi:hypothetical protein